MVHAGPHFEADAAVAAGVDEVAHGAVGHGQTVPVAVAVVPKGAAALASAVLFEEAFQLAVAGADEDVPPQRGAKLVVG